MGRHTTSSEEGALLRWLLCFGLIALGTALAVTSPDPGWRGTSLSVGLVILAVGGVAGLACAFGCNGFAGGLFDTDDEPRQATSASSPIRERGLDPDLSFWNVRAPATPRATEDDEKWLDHWLHDTVEEAAGDGAAASSLSGASWSA
jgi:hypothetical protein